MKAYSRKLVLQQLDKRIMSFSGQVNIPPPGDGWIHAIRSALNMTLEQLAKKIGIKAQSLKDFEMREKLGTITLNSLKDVANAIDMKLIYAIVPREGSLENLIEEKAWEKARGIVNRTAKTMELEDQANEKGRLLQALEDKKNELINEIPKFLWD